MSESVSPASELDSVSRIDQRHSVSCEGEPEAVASLLHLHGLAIKRYMLSIHGDFDLAETSFSQLRSKIESLSTSGQLGSSYRLLIENELFKVADPDPTQQANDSRPETARASERHLFLMYWRESILESTWARLGEIENQSGQPYCTVFRARVAHPKMTTRQLIGKVEDELKESYNPNSFRLLLRRSRRRFAKLLHDQVAETFKSASENEIQAELVTLGLDHFMYGNG